jgi:hypothetical protein
MYDGSAESLRTRGYGVRGPVQLNHSADEYRTPEAYTDTEDYFDGDMESDAESIPESPDPHPACFFSPT